MPRAHWNAISDKGKTDVLPGLFKNGREVETFPSAQVNDSTDTGTSLNNIIINEDTRQLFVELAENLLGVRYLDTWYPLGEYVAVDLAGQRLIKGNTVVSLNYPDAYSRAFGLFNVGGTPTCLLYTSPSPRDRG